MSLQIHPIKITKLGIMLEKASKVDYGVFVFILGLVFQHVVFSVA